MNLKMISDQLVKVRDIYSSKYQIVCDDDWYVLKIQEELGELTSAYLKSTGRARVDESLKIDLDKNLRDEIADVIGITLLFAKHRGIDVEQALTDKWFKHLN